MGKPRLRDDQSSRHKTVEEMLASLTVAGFTRPEDAKDASGKTREMGDRLEIALLRASAANADASRKVETESKNSAPENSADGLERMSKLLDASQVEASTARAEVATLRGQLADLRAENTRLQQTINGYSRDVVVALATSERDAANARADHATGLMERMEGFCGVRGISRDQAPPALDGPSGETAEHYEERLKSARTPAERSAIVKEFEVGCKSGRIKPGA